VINWEECGRRWRWRWHGLGWCLEILAKQGKRTEHRRSLRRVSNSDVPDRKQVLGQDILYDLLTLKFKELCSCEMSESDCCSTSLKEQGPNAAGWSVTEFTVRRHKTETWTPASNHDAHNLETHVIRNKLQQRRTLRGPQGVR